MDDLLFRIIRKACETGEKQQTKPTTKIEFSAPNGSTVSIELGVGILGWLLAVAQFVAILVLSVLGRAKFNFSRGQRLGGLPLTENDKSCPERQLQLSTAPTRPALPTPPARPALPERPVAVVHGVEADGEGETSSLHTVKSEEEEEHW